MSNNKALKALKGCTIVTGFNYSDWFCEEIERIEGDVKWKGTVYVLGSLCVRGTIFFDGVALETETIEEHGLDDEMKFRRGMKQLEESEDGEKALDDNISANSYRDLMWLFIEAVENDEKPLIYKDHLVIIEGDLYIHKRTKIEKVAFAD